MNLFRKKDPLASAKAEYQSLMKAAMEAQRGGDIVRAADLHTQADKLYTEKIAPGEHAH